MVCTLSSGAQLFHYWSKQIGAEPCTTLTFITVVCECTFMYSSPSPRPTHTSCAAAPMGVAVGQGTRVGRISSVPSGPGHARVTHYTDSGTNTEVLTKRVSILNSIDIREESIRKRSRVI